MERFSSFQLIVSAVIELVAPGSTSQGTKRFLHPVVESTTPQTELNLDPSPLIKAFLTPPKGS